MADDDVILALPNEIVVRRYRAEDVPCLSRHGNNKKIWDNLRNRMPHPYTEDAARTWVTQCAAPESQRGSGAWTAESGSQGPPVHTNYTIVIAGEACGSIGLDFGDAQEIYFRCAEIGYWLSEKHWGKGVMSVVVPAFVDWTWRTFGILMRLNAEVSAVNAGSLKCLQKAGFTEEGRKKCAFVKNGIIFDEVSLGMLRPNGT